MTPNYSQSIRETAPKSPVQIGTDPQYMSLVEVEPTQRGLTVNMHYSINSVFPWGFLVFFKTLGDTGKIYIFGRGNFRFQGFQSFTIE